MPRQAARATTPEPMTTFAPVETHTNHNGNGSAVISLVDHVEQIKDNLKNVIRDLTTVIDAVKTAEKERRTSDGESQVPVPRAIPQSPSISRSQRCLRSHPPESGLKSSTCGLFPSRRPARR